MNPPAVSPITHDFIYVGFQVMCVIRVLLYLIIVCVCVFACTPVSTTTDNKIDMPNITAAGRSIQCTSPTSWASPTLVHTMSLARLPRLCVQDPLAAWPVSGSRNLLRNLWHNWHNHVDLFISFLPKMCVPPHDHQVGANSGIWCLMDANGPMMVDKNSFERPWLQGVLRCVSLQSRDCDAAG